MLDWIESISLSVAIRGGGLPYPIIGGLHLLSIALFGGMLLVTDLRMLGWALNSRKLSDIWYLALPWKRLGFLIVVLTGRLLMWAHTAVPQSVLLGQDGAICPGRSACVGISPRRLRAARKTGCRNNVAGKSGCGSISDPLGRNCRRWPADCV